jgi:NADH-quinone oxidoreductase subunit L
MSILAILAIVAGYIEIPGVDSGISRFLAPTFAGSDLYSRTPSAGTSWVGLIVGTLVGLAGISIAYVLYIRERGIPARLQQRLPAVHAFLYNKWYFDEAIEVIVVRPALFLGRFAGSTLENGLIGGGVTGSTTGLARALSASVRRAQTGFLRYYVALMIVGIGSMSLYFLLQTT